MWPWEHVAIGYIAYSLGSRLTDHEPTAGGALAVGFGSLFPDLVDKPLAWYLGVLPAGRTLAHSLLVAVPVCFLVLFWARQHDRLDVGAGFSLGYLLHLPADAVVPALFGRPTSYDFLFWPVRSVPTQQDPSQSLTASVQELLTEASTVDLFLGLLAEAVLLGTAVVLWHRDGYPGLSPVAEWLLRRIDDTPSPDPREE